MVTTDTANMYGFEETMGEEEDQFAAGQEQYPFATWMNGIKQVDRMDGKKTVIGEVIGWCFQANVNGAEFDGAMDNLCAIWQEELETSQAEKREADTTKYCRKVYLLHSDGAVKEYYNLPYIEIFPLAYGCPSPYAITHEDGLNGKPTMRLGVANFWWSDRDKTTGEFKDGKGHTKVLAVVKALFEAGYADVSGNPLPVTFTGKSYTGVDLFTALSRHAAEVIKYVREVEGQSKAPYFAFSLSMYPADETVKRGKPGQQSDVYPILCGIPPRGKLSTEYTSAHFCGRDMVQPLLRLTKEVALPWCERQVTAGVVNQVKAGRWKGEIPKSAQAQLGQSDAETQQGMPVRAGSSSIIDEQALQFANANQVDQMRKASQYLSDNGETDLAASMDEILGAYSEDAIPYDIAFGALEGARDARRRIEASKKAAPGKPAASGRPTFGKRS